MQRDHRFREVGRNICIVLNKYTLKRIRSFHNISNKPEKTFTITELRYLMVISIVSELDLYSVIQIHWIQLIASNIGV